MKIIDNTTVEVLAGERFSQIISGFDFDLVSQITILLYRSNEAGYSLAWTKTASDKYLDAGTIEKREEDAKMVFTIDTTGLATGKYDIEARVDVPGVLSPIVKQRSEFLTIKPSRT